MGITPNIMLALAEFSGRYRSDASAAMIGRQQFRLRGPVRRWRLDRALARHKGAPKLRDLLQSDGFSEQMFKAFGFAGVETFDASDYEVPKGEPVVVHDLNEPVPQSLHGRYGFIFDGGTLEHGFNVPMALENLSHMLQPGGRLIGVNPLDGWPGHGMYQFSAELIYGFWQRMAGCKVVSCRAYRTASGTYSREIADPALVGHRTRFRSWTWPFSRVPPGRIFLHYEIEKPVGADLKGVAMQPDYVTAWTKEKMETL